MAPIRAAFNALALAAGTVAIVVSALVAIPDGTDYVQVTLDKHDRLAANVPRKMVFVGGSNLAYGLDSAVVQQDLGYHVVNMGLNAYLGVRFLLEEVRGEVRAGDVVVLSFEHELFFRADDNDFIDGNPDDHLLMIKARPASWRYLTTWTQRWRVLKAAPRIAQRKVFRAVLNGIQYLRGRETEESGTLLQWVERNRAGFNEYGDLTRHLSMKLDVPMEEGRKLNKNEMRHEAFVLMRRFSEDMEAKGIRVVFIPPPTPEGYYARQRPAIEALYRRLASTFRPGAFVSYERYVFPDSFFLADVNHLGTSAARATRTLKVIDDLRSRIADSLTQHPVAAG
jgi:hypothetical protein